MTRHRLAAGRRLVLGGVEIPHERGLDGHSDADVLAHAVIDALLGAAGLGDIGEHFPDTDERWRDADSIELLRAGRRDASRARGLRDRQRRLHRGHGGAQARAPPRARSASAWPAALGLEPERVNVKATHRRGDGLRRPRRGRRGAGDRCRRGRRSCSRSRPARGPAARVARRWRRSACTTPAAASCSRSRPRDPGRRRDLRLRPDRLQPHPHRQRAAVRRLQPARALPRARGLRGRRSSSTSPTSTTRSTTPPARQGVPSESWRAEMTAPTSPTPTRSGSAAPTTSRSPRRRSGRSSTTSRR